MELKTYFAQDDKGNLLPGATCYLYQAGTSLPVSGLQDGAGAALTNPFKADSNGRILFSAPNGIYDLRIVSGTRDYRARIQCNDLTEVLESANKAADRAEDAAGAAGEAVQSVTGLASLTPAPGKFPVAGPDGTIDAEWFPGTLLDDINGKATAATEAAQQAATAAQQAVATTKPSPFLAPYNAKGDGVTNDTAAFTLWEATNKGLQVDLMGRTVIVDAVPRQNAYHNGRFKVATYTREQQLPFTFMNQPGRFMVNGGQIAKLRQALQNPFMQRFGMIFSGDSITWGSGTGENMAFEPRNGTLKDARDGLSADSYVNIIKRWIQSQHLDGAPGVTSNWAYSPSGESIVTYKKSVKVVPEGEGITVTTSGPSVSSSRVSAEASPTLFQWRFGDANAAGTSYHSIKFKFTGGQFTLSFGNVATTGIDYQIIVDGQTIGQYSTKAGAPCDNGAVVVADSYDNRRTHTFSWVHDKTVEIRTVRNPTEGATQFLRLCGILIDREIKISNQGINGATFRTYNVYAMGPAAPRYSGAPALGAEDLFQFIQLGVNDRGESIYPMTQGTLQVEIEKFLSYIPAQVSPILMVANPCVETGFKISMQDVRSVLSRVAVKHKIDFIDNYACWAGSLPHTLAKDGVHPNVEGMRVIAQNIILAIENAHAIITEEPPEPVVIIEWEAADPAKFPVTASHSAMVATFRDAAAAHDGKQLLLNSGNTTAGSNFKVKFNVTGSDRLDIAYSTNPGAQPYELFFDGVSQGVFDTAAPTATYANVRTHSIPAKSGATAVEVRVTRVTPTGNVATYLESFGILKGGTFS